MKKKQSKVIQNNSFHYFSEVTEPNSETRVSEVEVLRCGTIHDRELDITAEMLADYVKNFKSNVYGTEIQVNLEHNRGGEAAGWVKDLFVNGNKLMATVEWTELGEEKITKKLFKFVSAELAYKYPHHQTGKLVNNVFIGLALTNTPALKGQEALSLEEQLNKLLIECTMFKKFLQSLKEREIVSKEDKALMMSMLEELPEEEKTEVQPEVDEVNAKPEEKEKTEEEKKAEQDAIDAKAKTDADAAAAAAAAGDQGNNGQQDLEEKNNVVKLTEQLNQANAEKEQLAEKLRKVNLAEEVKNKYLITKDRKVGIQEADLQSVVDFIATLSEEQAKTFEEVFGKVRAADLATIGDSTSGANLSEEEKMVEAEKEAKEMSAKTGKPLADCLAEVYKAKNLVSEK